MKVLAINASARKNGNTAIAIKKVFEPLTAAGIETEMIQLSGEKIHGCRACYQCKENANKKCVCDDDIVNKLLPKILEADALILASPTYFADMSTEMKAFIDRVGFVSRANGNLLKRKVGAAVVTVRRGGAINTFDSINHFFLISEMIIAGSNYWNIVIGGPSGEAEKDSEGLQTMTVLGENIAWLLKRIGEKK